MAILVSNAFSAPRKCMTDKLKTQALEPMLRNLRVEQCISFEEAISLIREFQDCTGGTLWPALSGNGICAFANLVIARYAARAKGGDEA